MKLGANSVRTTYLLLALVLSGSTWAEEYLESNKRRNLRSQRELQNCAELPTNLYFQLLNSQTHLALHVVGGSKADGANVVSEVMDAGFHDTFRLVRSGLGNFYHIVAQHSNKVIAGRLKIVLEPWSS